MISTALANLSVGPPYDLGIYERDSYQLLHARIEGDSPFLTRLSETWREHMLAAVDVAPRPRARRHHRVPARQLERAPTAVRLAHDGDVSDLA